MYYPTPLDYILIGIGFFCLACFSAWGIIGVGIMVSDLIHRIRGQD